MAYDHAAIEKKAQEKWAKLGLYKSVEDSSKKKKYILDMFPYPSGEGLHVGHPKGYIATDIYSRFSKMNGYAILHPMGWDAFGLPAENFALKHKTHPRKAVEQNIATFKAQLEKIGFNYDWSREINTTDPSYYHWTQWIFLKMLEHGLAYQSNEPINWCPSCMTGLANEDLDGNVCERCGTPVVKKKLPQWVLKITEYADRMLTDLDTLDWPEHIKEAQRNWIGRSEGAEIEFSVGTEKVTVFTTRPDTIFGATYLVLAPEHALVEKLVAAGAISNVREVKQYLSETMQKSEIERGAEGREKTGVKLEGVSAVNPATKEEIPIYVADYVLGSYGTGAIMAVPAHDERDFAFAKKFSLPIKHVVMPVLQDKTNLPREGKENTFRNVILAIVHDPKTDTYLTLKWKKLPWQGFVTGGVEENENREEAAKREIAEETGYTNVTLVRSLGWSEAHFFAEHKDVNRKVYAEHFLFELVDNTRVEIPKEEREQYDIAWCTMQQLKQSDLRHAEKELLLSRVQTGNDSYTGFGTLINSEKYTGQNSEEAMWEIVKAVGGRKTVRYKLRDWVFSRQRYWGEPIPVIHCEKDGIVPVPYEELPVTLPEVDHYEPTGTGESPLAAITEWVNVKCPKCGGPAKRETNTMPQWAGSSWYYLRFMDPHNPEEFVSRKKEKYWAPVDVYVGGDHAVRHLIYARFWHKFLHDLKYVSTSEPFARLEFLGFILAEDGRKMSKRFGNVINPDDVVAQYGADAFRLYEMFMGPFENTTAWSTGAIQGTARFVERVWSMQKVVSKDAVPAIDKALHETIRKVGSDIEAFKFNTAVSQMMIFINAVEDAGAIGEEQWSQYLRVLAPFAPHITEALWEVSGHKESIHAAEWPAFNESALASTEVEVVVQVNGKRRGSVTLAPDAAETEAVAAATALAPVDAALAGKTPSRVVYVPGRIINLVV